MPDGLAAHLATLLAGGILAGIGLLIRRQITGAGHQERVGTYAHLAEISAKMKEHGVSMDEIAALDGFIRGKRREAVLAAKSEESVSIEEGAYDARYWSQAAMNERAAASLDTTTAQLHEALLELEHYLGSNVWAVHATWETFRDQHAELASSQYEGGSIAPLIQASEAELLTQQRLAWVRSQLEDLERR